MTSYEYKEEKQQHRKEQKEITHDVGEKDDVRGDTQGGILKNTTSSAAVSSCDFYKINLADEQEEWKKTRLFEEKRPVYKSLRYYIIALALISPFIVTYSRTIINFAITDMINPDSIESAPPDSAKSAFQSTATGEIKYYFELDNSCPVDDADRKRLIEETNNDIKRATSGDGEKFDWDTFDQGLLKSAYTIGHALFQILGSRLSEIHGSHRIMSICSLLIATCCLLAPYLASVHLYMIFIDLFLLGALGSFMTPALISLFANWLTPGEKSIALSLLLVASRLGSALSSMLCGLLIGAQLSWRYVFFSVAWVSLPFSILFFFGARSRPQEHPKITKQELNYLASKNTLVAESLADEEKDEKSRSKLDNYELRSQANIEINDKKDITIINEKKEDRKERRKNSAPWLAILTNVPVWAFIVTKFCVKMAGDVAQIELPTYLKKVMHFSARTNGSLNAWNYIIFCTGCFVAGVSAKIALKRRPFGLGKTSIRKCFQSFASFGVSLSLLGLAYSACYDTWTEIFLMSNFFLTTFGVGGEAQIPLDITERYSGTVHAIGSSLAISGFLAPILVGSFLRGHAADRDSWKMVWIAASAFSFIGGSVFVLFADTSIQPFDSIVVGEEDKEEEVEKKKRIKSEEKNGQPDLDGQDNPAFI